MHVPKSDQEWRAFRRWLSLGLTTGGALSLVVLLAHTAVGAITAQPGPWMTAAQTALGFAVAMTIWRLDDVDRPASDLHGRISRLVGAWLAALLFALLVARQGGVAIATAVAATWAFAGAYFVCHSMKTAGESVENCSGQTSATAPAISSPVVDAKIACPGQLARPETADPAMRLVLHRSATVDGESIDIQARLQFAAGAREAVLHVPFWPALAAAPEVEGEPLDADDVELKFTSVERYGIRLEARLASATVSGRTVLVGIELHAPAQEELSAAA